ncbi:hypothetical protein T439DRAFT_120234 [Meredithblackwellia eburnea MCA 4105]
MSASWSLTVRRDKLRTILEERRARKAVLSITTDTSSSEFRRYSSLPEVLSPSSLNRSTPSSAASVAGQSSPAITSPTEAPSSPIFIKSEPSEDSLNQPNNINLQMSQIGASTSSAPTPTKVRAKRPPRPKNLTCGWPGCGRVFAIQYHYQRHLNSHLSLEKEDDNSDNLASPSVSFETE